MKRVPGVGAFLIGIRLGVEQPLDYGGASVRDRHVQWRRTIVGWLIWIGAEYEKSCDEFAGRMFDGEVECAPALRVLCRKPGAELQEPVDNCRVSAHHCQMQCGCAVPIADRNVCAPREQEFDPCASSRPDGMV